MTQNSRGFLEGRTIIYVTKTPLPVYFNNTVLSCRTYRAFTNCMRTVKPYCGKTDRLRFMGIDNYYSYLCEEKFTGKNAKVMLFCKEDM